ncbi:MAG: protein-disulfide reductase DsbD [bacterium]
MSSFILLILLALVYKTSAQNEDIVQISISQKGIRGKAGEQFQVTLQVNIKSTWHINSCTPKDESLIPTLVTAMAEGIKLVKVDYPEAHDVIPRFSKEALSVYEGDAVCQMTFEVEKTAKAGMHKIEVQLKYQACDADNCLPPNKVTTILEVNTAGGAAKEAAPVSVATKEDPKTPEKPTKDQPVQQQNTPATTTSQQAQTQMSEEQSSLGSTLEKSGMAISLLLIFLGGLALNLTPCVYPLIPITIGYFGGQSEGRTSRLFLLGLLYMLGMALTYSVVGVVTALSGAMFGALLQNMYVIIGIAALFVVLALSQFGVYEFKLPDSLTAMAGGAKSGTFGAFFMGLTMGIVAAPCIGPFVLGLVTYVAAKGDPFNGFLMFFVLALGLGFPYLLLALFSGKIKKLPRSGEWMEGVKHLFGFLLLGMAFYFVNPILPKSIQSYVLPVYGILAVLIFVLFDKTANSVKFFKRFKYIFSLAILALSIYALIPSKKTSPEWQKFSIEAYDASLKNQERMIIDFYADWCIPCKELDAMTFSDSRVVDELKKFTAYKADMTQSESDETTKLTERFKIKGVPTVLIINAKGEEVERLTGFVNAEEFLKLIAKAK